MDKNTKLVIISNKPRKLYTYSPGALARMEERKRIKSETAKANKTVVEATIRNTNLNQTQNITISKGLIKSLGEGDRININYSPVMVVSADKEPKSKFSELQELMWHIIDSLPNPKLKNLRKLAVKTCLDRFSNLYGAGQRTAEYLDLQRTYVSKIKMELKDDSLFNEESSTICLPTNIE